MRIFRQGQGIHESAHLRGDVACHVAQANPKIDAEIGEIDHFWMDTSSIVVSRDLTLALQLNEKWLLLQAVIRKM